MNNSRDKKLTNIYVLAAIDIAALNKRAVQGYSKKLASLLFWATWSEYSASYYPSAGAEPIGPYPWHEFQILQKSCPCAQFGTAEGQFFNFAPLVSLFDGPLLVLKNWPDLPKRKLEVSYHGSMKFHPYRGGCPFWKNCQEKFEDCFGEKAARD
jgi:hypothetical protein